MCYSDLFGSDLHVTGLFILTDVLPESDDVCRKENIHCNNHAMGLVAQFEQPIVLLNHVDASRIATD